MKNLRRVVWSRGMFLTPQHFQTLDNFIEDSLQFRFNASNYCNWGVVDLGIDQESLANGLFTIHHCRGRAAGRRSLQHSRD
jgi:type VI secretion system protein ImpJ